MEKTTLINILSEDVIKRIAAGEVVERPASVLKELLENSLDAGAKKISVDIEKAGKSLIRVHDDGSGMSPEDCRLSIRRHATSKITSFQDLESLSTFGFRGEALYSIAAVSRLTITTCRAAKGWTIRAEGGKIISESPGPPVGGTTVEVRNLFFNTPARAKFLRSDPSERSHLLRAAEECALANCKTAFHVKTDGVEVFSLPPSDDSIESVLSRARVILGKTQSRGLIRFESDFCRMRALMGHPENMPASRGAQYFFVNKRPVSSRTLQQAVYRAYEPFKTSGRHPVCIVFIELSPEEFDVNIHPQKKEIRFKNENDIFKAVSSLVGERLLKERRPVPITPDSPAAPPGAGGPSAQVFEPKPEYYAGDRQGDMMFPQMEAGPSGPGWYRPPFRFLGSLEKSYLVLESNGGLLVIDQHAAAERVIFERYMNQLCEKKPKIQPLMLPVSADISPSQMQNAMRWKEWLAGAGFELEAFGPGTVLLHSVPAVFDFGPDDLKEFLERLSEILGDPQKCPEDVKRETIATLACRKAVKAHDSLKSEEALRLVEDLKSCRDSFTCPHGRPTILSLSRNELARRFQRSSAPPQ